MVILYDNGGAIICHNGGTIMWWYNMGYYMMSVVQSDVGNGEGDTI